VELIQSVKNPSRLHKDFVCRCLKSEAQFLFGILKTAEQSESPEDGHIKEALKISVVNLKGLIKFLSS